MGRLELCGRGLGFEGRGESFSQLWEKVAPRSGGQVTKVRLPLGVSSKAESLTCDCDKQFSHDPSGKQENGLARVAAFGTLIVADQVSVTKPEVYGTHVAVVAAIIRACVGITVVVAIAYNTITFTCVVVY